MRTGLRLVLLLTLALLAARSPWWASGQPLSKPAEIFIPFSEHALPQENFGEPSAVRGIDLDRDGDMDIVATAFGTTQDNLAWWENNGSQSFTYHTIAADFDDARSLAALDIDGDGDIDLLAGHTYYGALAWWENNGSQVFTQHTLTSLDVDEVDAADLDQDGDIDLIAVSLSDDRVAWWENDGHQVFTAHYIEYPNGPNSIQALDVDGDHDIDLVGSIYWGAMVVWWENDGSQNFTRHTIEAASYSSPQDVLGLDLDQDGDMDVLVSTLSGVNLYENNGSESFTLRTIVDTGCYSAVVADINQDALPDVVISGGGISWWKNLGNGSFRGNQISTTYSAYEDTVFALDIDKDGDQDVLGAFVGGISWFEQLPPQTASFLPIVLLNVGAPQSAPVLAPIANPDMDQTFAPSWSAVPRATRYVLQQDDNQDFTSPTAVYAGANISTTVSVGATGVYYYRVQPTNDMGAGPWSNTEAVTVTQITGIVPQAGKWTCTTFVTGASVSFIVQPDQGSVTDGKISISCGSVTIPGPAPIINSTFDLIEAGGHGYLNITFDSATHGSGPVGINKSGSCGHFWQSLSCEP